MDSDTAARFRPLPLNPEELIVRRDVPLYIPIAAQTLAKLAVIGGGPRYARIGRRAVYRAGDLRDWFQSRSRSNTSQRP